MQYLYTNDPDKDCHEVSPGVFGRPVHTSEQPKLKRRGWAMDPGAVTPAQKKTRGRNVKRKAEHQND